MMRGRGGSTFWSFGGLVLALLALALTRVQQQAMPPSARLPGCAAPLALAVSPPATLPPPLASTRPASTPAPPATPEPVAPTAVPPTASVSTPSSAPPSGGTPASQAASTPDGAAPRIADLLRADDPPQAHGLQVESGGLLPLVVPQPCALSHDLRPGPEPCVRLLPPSGRLCASGVVADGRFSSDVGAPVIALQAARVTLSAADGTLRFDALQGYVRYDDPAQGLRLLCPEIRLLQSVGPNARTFVALCQNNGQNGWAISGQATDGSNAAPDTVGLTIDAPDGSSRMLAGALAAGAVQVRTPAGESSP